jgi:ABC-2 type transport system ATP-binding protein
LVLPSRQRSRGAYPYPIRSIRLIRLFFNLEYRMPRLTNRKQKSLVSASNRVLAASSSISNPSPSHFPIGKRVAIIKLRVMDTSAPAATTFAAETVGLTKRYPLTWKRKVLVAIDKLDLQVKTGEVFGLLGPNGSGKSTTLKLLLGLIVPSEGEARIFGMPPESLDARRRVGFLPENPYFYGFLTGDETLRFYGKICGVTGARLEKRIEELIDLVGLQNGRERPLRSYSKGMLQRIGLAQALIHDPDLLFLDEPTAGVDPLGSAQIRDLILRLKKMGKTVIFSSHLLEQVQEVADRVAIFSLGKKVLEGSLDSLLTENHGTEINISSELTTQQRERLLKALAEAGIDTSGEAVRFSQPHLSLEQLYLRTVQGQVGSHTQDPGTK